MTDLPSHIRGRAETKAAKDAEERQGAAQVWRAVEAERRALDERTARLRVMRLATTAEATV